MVECWLPDWEVDYELEFEVGLWKVPRQEAKEVPGEVSVWVSAAVETEGVSVACIAPEVLWRKRLEELTTCRKLWTSMIDRDLVRLVPNSPSHRRR